MSNEYPLVAGDERLFAILQFDIKGHSGWSDIAPQPDIRHLKELISGQASAIAGAYGGTELAYAGDGGVYIFLVGSENPHHPRSVDLAVIAGIQLQLASRPIAALARIYGLPAEPVLRVSVHLATMVVGSKPGTFSGEGLNWFLKCERQIGRSGQLTITNAVWKRLAANLRPLFRESGEALVTQETSTKIHTFRSSHLGLTDVRVGHDLGEFQARLANADDITLVGVTVQCLVLSDQTYFQDLLRSKKIQFAFLDPRLLDNTQQASIAIRALEEILELIRRDEAIRQNVKLNVVLNRIHFGATIMDWETERGELRIQPYCQHRKTGETPMLVFQRAKDPVADAPASAYVDSVHSMINDSSRCRTLTSAQELMTY